ncbi:MAG TPA: DUF2975 domain-containing protein [Flavisolibacter sp.]
MLKRTVSIVAITVALLITLYFFAVRSLITSSSTGPFGGTWAIDMPNSDTAFGGLFYAHYIDDSLPYYRYRRIDDSIKRIKDAISLNNRSMGSGTSIGPVAVMEITAYKPFWWENTAAKDPVMKSLQDSADMLDKAIAATENHDSLENIKQLLGDVRWRINVHSNQKLRDEHHYAEKQYYLGLNGYTPRDQHTQFFLDENGFNLAYVVWDSVHRRTFDSTVYGHYERKKIPVRYAAAERRILIPITKQQHRYAALALEWGWFPLLFLGIYLFIGLPLQIVLNISKGRAFTIKNIHRFRLMSVASLVYALLGTFLPYVLRLIFQDLIPHELELVSFSRNLFSQISTYFMALVLYLISLAFQKGYSLQQDNSLTI